MEEIYQVFTEELDKYFYRTTNHFDQRFEDMEKDNNNNQCLAGLQHQSQQPHLAVDAEVRPGPTTRERTEGAAADEEKYGDISSSRVDDDPMHLTSFDDLAQSSGLPVCRDDALVNEGAEALKPDLSLVEMRASTLTGRRLSLYNTEGHLISTSSFLQLL